MGTMELWVMITGSVVIAYMMLMSVISTITDPKSEKPSLYIFLTLVSMVVEFVFVAQRLGCFKCP